MGNLSAETPIVTTGGDTGLGYVVRGDVVVIDYDEAAENAEYARRVLAEARAISAPDSLIEELAGIVEDHDQG